MAEIDRIDNVVAAFFRVFSNPQTTPKQHAAFRQAIGACWQATLRRIAEQNLHSNDIEKRAEEGQRLMDDFEKMEAPTLLFVRVVLRSIMTTRRATYPIKSELPWGTPPTPEQALVDDEDIYSFAIFDTVADEIQKLLPTLFQLASEG